VNDPSEIADSTTVYDILKVPRRRHVLRVLLRSETQIPLETLAARVNERERLPPSETPRFPELQIARTLHHSHLPRLADADVIDYDAATREVVSLDRERLDSLLASEEQQLSSLRGERTDTE
jgi:hypothetical protein